MKISPRCALCGYHTLTLVNASLTDKALIYLLFSGIAFCYFTATQLLYLLNLHLLFVKKKSSQILCNFDEVLFEKATFLIKAEVKIWHSELVTALSPFEVSVAFPLLKPSTWHAGESGRVRQGMSTQFLLENVANQIRFVGCLYNRTKN